ncbi:14580_t:CDS:2, partial [Cetraspora pellucida]
SLIELSYSEALQLRPQTRMSFKSLKIFQKYLQIQMELFPNQQSGLENSSLSWSEDGRKECRLPKPSNVCEKPKAVVDLHVLKQLLDKFQLAEKELRSLINEISFPSKINKFEKFLFSEMINPETTNEQIIEMRKIYNEFKTNNSKILENKCVPNAPVSSTAERHENQSNVNNLNNLEIKSSRCYETEKFDSTENIWHHHSPPPSVIHCELMTNDNCALDFNRPNLQVTTSTIESCPQASVNIGYSSENNYFIDTNQHEYIQQLLSNNFTIVENYREEPLLYYP